MSQTTRRTWLLLSTALALSAPLASATTVNVATPGNLLANTAAANIAVSSGPLSFGGPTTNAFDNLVGTSNQDNGHIFADTDAHQVLTVTGFNSSIAEIRLFINAVTDTVRLPGTLSIYYSLNTTASLDATSSDFTGTNGGQLVGPLTFPDLATAHVTFSHDVSNRISYASFLVSAPVGTESLLIDMGTAFRGANNGGDRIAELQAFAAPVAVPLPPGALAGAALLLPALLRRR